MLANFDKSLLAEKFIIFEWSATRSRGQLAICDRILWNSFIHLDIFKSLLGVQSNCMLVFCILKCGTED